MHFLGANLNFKRLAGVNHGGVQRLIEVRPGHGDVVLEAAGDGAPNLVNHAERCVTILHRVRDDANGEQIENLIERALLLLNFQVQRVDALDASLHFGWDSAFDHFVANRFLHVVKKAVEDFLLVGEFFLQFEKSFRFEIAEGEIFELAADEAHAKPVGDRRVNIERLAGDALLTLGIEIFERAHVVKTVGEFHHDHANVVDHGEQHLADVFGLARLWSEKIEAADFRGAFDQARDVRTKLHGNLFERNLCVFDDVVKQRGAERSDVELHVREKMRHFHRMRKIRLAGKARLRLVLLSGEIVGAAKEFEIVAGTVAADLVHQLDKAQINRAPCSRSDAGFSGRVHVGAYYSLSFGQRRLWVVPRMTLVIGLWKLDSMGWRKDVGVAKECVKSFRLLDVFSFYMNELR